MATFHLLSIGHSVTKGGNDYGHRPLSPSYSVIPEGGWTSVPQFQIERWGDAINTRPDGQGGWTVRAGDMLPINSLTTWNNGIGGAYASTWDTAGGSAVTAIFSGSQPAPALSGSITHAVIQCMINDSYSSISKAAWKASIQNVITYLVNTQSITPILCYDMPNGAFDHESFHVQYRAAVDELIISNSLPPVLDLHTSFLADMNDDQDLYYIPPQLIINGGTSQKDLIHPGAKGHIHAASLLATYLIDNSIVTIPSTAHHVTTDFGSSYISSSGDTECSVKQVSTGYLLDRNDNTFKASGHVWINPPMREINPSGNPGRYGYYLDPTSWSDGTYKVTSSLLKNGVYTTNIDYITITSGAYSGVGSEPAVVYDSVSNGVFV